MATTTKQERKASTMNITEILRQRGIPYIESGKNVKQEPEDVRAKRYNTFNDMVWKTDLKPLWLPVLVESGKITADQKTEIENRFKLWQSAITPVSPIVYGLIIILFAIVLWSLSRYIRKKPVVTKT